MQVRKRNGSLEPVDVNKIVRAVERCSYGLSHVDAIRVASKTIGGLYDGATTRELDSMSIQTAASLIAEEPEYSRLAARLLLATIVKEVSARTCIRFRSRLRMGIRKVLYRRNCGVCADECTQVESCDRRSASGPLRVFRAADCLRPVFVASSDIAKCYGDAAALLSAGVLRFGWDTCMRRLSFIV